MDKLLLQALLAISRVYQRLRLSVGPSTSAPMETWELLPFDFRVDWLSVDKIRVVLGNGEFDRVIELRKLHDVSICAHCGSPILRK